MEQISNLSQSAEFKLDKHLNLFKSFTERNNNDSNDNTELDKEILSENNLSRAFAICLIQSRKFCKSFLDEISASDFDSTSTDYSQGVDLFVNLQVVASYIDITKYRKVFAIGITADNDLCFTNFKHQKNTTSEKTRTDITISINDIIIVIEVKKDETNCQKQLEHQIYDLFRGKNEIEYCARAISWHKILTLAMQIDTNVDNGWIVKDFVSFIDTSFPLMIPSKPFNVLNSNLDVELNKRLKFCLQRSKSYEFQQIEKSFSLLVRFKWANRFGFSFSESNLVIRVHTANTKGQGYSIYAKSLDWVKNKEVEVDGEKFTMETKYEVKLSDNYGGCLVFHAFESNDFVQEIHKRDGFDKSGRYGNERHPELKFFFDQHFVTDIDWQEKLEWKKIEDQKMVLVSFGFTTDIYIPFEKLQDIDTGVERCVDVANFFENVINQFKHTIESQPKCNFKTI